MPRLVLPQLSALAAAATFAFAPAVALAVDYSDIYYTPSAPGSGYQVVQSDNFMFVTFFVYDQNKQATFYTAQLTLDANGNYTGALYRTTGTYFALPYNVADSSIAQVGTASFQPSASNDYQATLTYTVNGAGTVTRAIERQTLTAISLAGTYTGGQNGMYSGCTNSADNGSYTDTYDTLTVTQSGSTASLQFTYNSGATCTLSGTLVQNGTLYRITGATYQCSGAFSVNSTANISDLKATSLGLEGGFVSNVGGGCTESAVFSAAFNFF